jgi:hypothetical protein
MYRRGFILFFKLFVVLAPHPGAAAERHLLTIAAHRGTPGEVPLRFARRDAERIRKVFQHLGGVQPANTVMLVDPSSSDVRRTLGALGNRLKKDDTLVLYISAHMDSRAIHLGPERLPFERIFSGARDTGASLRVFVLDGCQSGAVTAKGLRRGRVRVIRPRPRPATGEVVLTSTAPGEDALESQRLSGSFFTHYVVTGLRGAADRDRDGRVTVEELYRFAHDRTVYATAGSPTGSQHPSFRLDLAGSGTFVLSEKRAGARTGARLRVSKPRKGVAYLLNRATGQLEAEVPLQRRGSVIVPPGRYRVRVATARRVREAAVTLRRGSVTEIHRLSLRSVPLLALVRKGEGQARSRALLCAGFEAGLSAEEGFGPLLGARISGSLEWRSVSLSLGLSYGHASTQSSFVSFNLHHIGLAAGITHPLSLGPLVLAFGLSVEGIVILQQLEPLQPGGRTDGGRGAFVLGLTPLARLELPLASRWVPALSFRGRVLFGGGARVRFAPVGSLGLGWVF